MFGFCIRRRDPTPVEQLVALVGLDIWNNPEAWTVREPCHSGHWTILSGPEGVRVTTEAGLCGNPWRDLRINDVPISRKMVKELLNIHKQRKEINKLTAGESQVHEKIQRFMERRKRYLQPLK